MPHAPGSLFEGVVCPSASSRDLPFIHLFKKSPTISILQATFGGNRFKNFLAGIARAKKFFPPNLILWHFGRCQGVYRIKILKLFKVINFQNTPSRQMFLESNNFWALTDRPQPQTTNNIHPTHSGSLHLQLVTKLLSLWAHSPGGFSKLQA